MDRRAFVRLGAIAGAMAVRGKPLAGQTLANGEGAQSLNAKPRFSTSPFALEEATLADLQAGMAAGTMTARSITQQYLDRIVELDRQGPTLRHVLETNPDALSLADSLDQERKAGRVRGPLHGIPILLKDNIDTADRMTTTAGSLALAGSIPLQDAFIAAKLRAAGAILLGKRIAASGRTSARRTHRADGAGGAARRRTRTCSIGIRAARARVRAEAYRPTSAPPPSERRRMARLFVRRPPTASSESNRRWDS